MFESKRLILVGVMGAALLTVLFMVLSGRGQANQKRGSAVEQVPFGQSAKQIDDAAVPVVDFENPSIVDRIDKNARKQKNARYDHGVLPGNPLPNIGEIIGEPERRAGYSDLPANKSDVIVEAVVGDSKAFLSEDKTGVYSEFTILVSKVLKAAPGFVVNPGDTIAAERFGGKVRYPSGKVIRCRIEGEGVPIVGKRYIFFLAKADQDSYTLLTAYEMHGNKIFAVDAWRTNAGGQGASLFDKHTGEEFESFMEELERAMKNSHTGGS